MHCARFPSLARNSVACLVLLASVLLVATAFADPQTEKEAQALQKKAVQEDFLNLDYPSAIRKLQTAATKCGSDRCSPAVRGAVLRDLGAMMILGGSVEEGKANFGLAVAADATLELDPAYKNPRLEAAWATAKGQAPPPPPPASAAPPTPQPPRGEQPQGDFKHTPAPEQTVRTPLPVYTEYTGSETLKRVLVKYKGPGMSDWKPLDLQQMGDGWGGLIPCADVTEGSMQYFLQGFSPSDDPVATSGSRTAPYNVAVKPSIQGPEPSLPGKDPPKQCGELVGAECPPNFPGCNNKKAAGEDCGHDADCQSNSCVGGKCEDKKGGGEECSNDAACASGSCIEGKCSAAKKNLGEDCESSDECDSGSCKEGKCAGGGASSSYHRMWGGIGVALDVLGVPGEDDVCALSSMGTAVLTSGSPYVCYDPNQKTDFPGGGLPGKTLNRAIDISDPNRLDFVKGGLASGPLTLFASFDYALTPNWLVGARAGYEFLTYPGSIPGPAFAPVRLEARVTYLLGPRAINQSLAPVFFAGVGAGEFDAMVPVKVTLTAPPSPYQTGVVQENAWLTAGPVYATAGGGLRLAFGGEKKNIALTGLIKLEGAFGGTSGFLFGVAPELAVQYGF